MTNDKISDILVNPSPLKHAFIAALEICLPNSKISLCNTHLSANLHLKLATLSGESKLKPGSKLEEIYYLWTGASFLNISTSSGHDETLKSHFIQLASEELDETKMEKFMTYLNLYFTKTGLFKMER